MIELCKDTECTGCAACANICPKNCISMQPDKEGFLHPEINHKLCIECGACQKKCPVLTPKPKNGSPRIYAAFLNDPDLRMKSSSGGMFYALAHSVLDRNGVVFGAAFDHGFVLNHKLAERIDDVYPMMGSKYVQSNISDVLYREVLSFLKQGRPVLFVGTPCQVAACKQYVPDELKAGLLLVDIVCHGVPSQKLFLDYMHKLGANIGDEVKSFTFRDLSGWGVVSSFLTANNRRLLLSHSDNTYMYLFLNGYTFRPCCYQCSYATRERMGDITLADFWGIGEEKPYVHDTTKGVSLILVNNPQGENAIAAVADDITIEQRTLTEALRINHQLRKPSPKPRQRDNVYTYAFAHGLEETYNHYFETPYRRFRRWGGRILRMVKIMK